MMKYLALGDSYTIGEGLPPEESFPWQLVRLLRQRDALMAAPEVLATTGWTSGELQQAIDQASFAPPYDLVTLCIGVNNQYRGLSPDTYAQEFAELLDQAIVFAGRRPEHVFVLSIPDWGVTPFAADRDSDQISAELRAFNRHNARLAYARQASYLNITEISKLARRDDSLLAADHLHYSAKMYKKWVEQLLPKVWRVLLPGKNLHVPLLYQQEGDKP